MPKVKTRDWGPSFAHLQQHIGHVATSLQTHNADLEDEIVKVRGGNGQHAFARHGWQTGWEAQVVRTVAGVTPDQTFNPYGFNPSIRAWGSVMVASPAGLQIGRYGLDARGSRIVTPIHTPFIPTVDSVAPASGASAGHFISPMAQQFAMMQSHIKVKHWGKWLFGERKKKQATAVATMHPVRRMVVTTECPGRLLGLGFSQPKGTVGRSEEEARWLIEAFERRATFKEVMNGCPFSSGASRTLMQHALEARHQATTAALQLGNPIAFPQLTDLFDAMQLEVQSNHWVLSVWDRDNVGNTWKLVTAYATGGPTICEQAEMTVMGTSGPDGALTGRMSDGASMLTGTVANGKVFLR